MFDTEIQTSGSFWGVPQAWLRAIIEVESAWNPIAYNPDDPGGAWGLMQITGKTAGLYGVEDASTLFVPALNIDLGAHIVHDLMVSWGNDLHYVYSAYNSGSGMAWLTNETVRKNVEKVMAALAFYLQDEISMGLSVIAIVAVVVLLVHIWSKKP